MHSREGPGDFTHVFGIIPSRECNHGRNLQEAHLECISRTNLHTESDIAVEGKRHGVHELGGVGNQGEEGHTQEFLVYPRTLQDDIDNVDEEFYMPRSAGLTRCTMLSTYQQSRRIAQCMPTERWRWSFGSKKDHHVHHVHQHLLVLQQKHGSWRWNVFAGDEEH